jgi:hypothetical protein
MARLTPALLALAVGSLMSPTGSFLDAVLFAAVPCADWWTFDPVRADTICPGGGPR